MVAPVSQLVGSLQIGPSPTSAGSSESGVTTFYYWKKRIHEVASHGPEQVAAESPSRPP